MPRRFTSPSGFEILVGLDAGENERLSLKTARGHDYWFHAHEVAGAHVIMRTTAKNVVPPTKDIEWVAGLAANYSKARGPGKISVTVARAVDVTKPRWPSPVGTVDCVHFKVLRVLCTII